MNFDTLLSAELPPPHEDETRHLRQDILDELSDHLACSYRKELLSGAEADSARRRVLERFGNPAAIAAQLWVDAMKGKIMSQRLLVTACILLAISCLALAGMSWLQWDRMNRVQAELIAASQASQNAMLQQIKVLAKAVEKPRSPDWNPASFKLTEETAEGPPVAGLNVSFGKNGANLERISRVSDEKGIVDLDAVQPGGYYFSISTTPKDRFGSSWSTSGTVQIKPYQDLFKRIVCPQANAQRFPIRVQCEQPKELSGQRMFLHARFRGLKRTLPDGTTWDYTGLEEGDELTQISQGMGGGYSLPVPRLEFLIGIDDGKIERIRGAEPFYWSDGTIPINRDGLANPNQAALAPELLGHAKVAIRGTDRTPIPDEFSVLEGDHSLAMLAILRPKAQGSSDAPGVDLFDVIALVSFRGGLRIPRPDWLRPPRRPLDDPPLDFFSASIIASPSTLRQESPGWLAEKDRVNTWTIAPPKELTEAAVAALKAEVAQAQKPEVPNPKDQ